MFPYINTPCFSDSKVYNYTDSSQLGPLLYYSEFQPVISQYRKIQSCCFFNILYIFIPHPSENEKKQKQDRSEDRVNREITSITISYIFFLLLSHSLLMETVSPYIDMKIMEEVINLISSCYSHRLVQDTCIVFCLQNPLISFFLDIKSLLFYIF